jgi:hypothetical protein
LAFFPLLLVVLVFFFPEVFFLAMVVTAINSRTKVAFQNYWLKKNASKDLDLINNLTLGLFFLKSRQLIFHWTPANEKELKTTKNGK